MTTVILNKNVALLDGLLAFALLLILQFTISSLAVRSSAVRKIIKNEPDLIFYQGKILEHSLKKHCLTGDNVNQILRSKGYSSPEEIDAIVLESNGTFSVIKTSEG